MNAVDTNVFVYALDADEPVKQSKALELFQRLTLAAGSTVLPWQVAAELLSNLRKRQAAGKISATEVESRFGKFLALFPLAVPSARAFPTSFELGRRFSLSHWDSLLLAACKEAGVTTDRRKDSGASVREMLDVRRHGSSASGTMNGKWGARLLMDL